MTWWPQPVRDRVNEANQAVIDIRRVKAQLDDRLTRSKDSLLAAEWLQQHVNSKRSEVRPVQRMGAVA